MGRDIKIVQKKILQEVDQKCKERERKMRTILRVLSLGNGESEDS